MFGHDSRARAKQDPHPQAAAEPSAPRPTHDLRVMGATYDTDHNGVWGRTKVTVERDTYVRQDIYDAAMDLTEVYAKSERGLLDIAADLYNGREETYDVIEKLNADVAILEDRVARQARTISDFYSRFGEIAMACPPEVVPVAQPFAEQTDEDDA